MATVKLVLDWANYVAKASEIFNILMNVLEDIWRTCDVVKDWETVQNLLMSRWNIKGKVYSVQEVCSELHERESGFRETNVINGGWLRFQDVWGLSPLTKNHSARFVPIQDMRPWATFGSLWRATNIRKFNEFMMCIQIQSLSILEEILYGYYRQRKKCWNILTFVSFYNHKNSLKDSIWL